MNLFEGLEELGFSSDVGKNIDVFKKASVNKAEKPTIHETTPEEAIYEKTYKCPICDTTFKEVTVKRAKVKLVSTDTDLRSYYSPVDPMYYDIILCKSCGYTSLPLTFERITSKQMTTIKNEITPKYRPKEYPLVITTDIAIERYKFALLNAVIKGCKSGEKAYLCMRLAWLYRDKKEEAYEKLFLQNAYVGFKEAYTTERFPIFGIEENVMTYLIGEFARRLGDYGEALKWIGTILVTKNINPRLKERALTQKDAIKAEMKKLSETS